MLRLMLIGLLLVSPALAQEVTVVDESVQISGWEEWVIRLSAAASSFFQPMIELGIVGLIGLLPFWLRPIANKIARQEADKLLERAVQWGINNVKGASVDSKLTIPVGNKVVAEALAYVLKHGSSVMLKFLEDDEKIKQKIVARLNLPATTDNKALTGVKPLDKVEQSTSAKASWTLPPALTARENKK